MVGEFVVASQLRCRDNVRTTTRFYKLSNAGFVLVEDLVLKLYKEQKLKPAKCQIIKRDLWAAE